MEWVDCKHNMKFDKQIVLNSWIGLNIYQQVKVRKRRSFRPPSRGLRQLLTVCHMTWWWGMIMWQNSLVDGGEGVSLSAPVQVGGFGLDMDGFGNSPSEPVAFFV